MRRLGMLVLLVALGALAHDADVIYVDLSPGAQPGELKVLVTLTPASLSLLAPLDADGDGLLSQADLEARRRALDLGVWEEAPLTAGGTRCERLRSSATLHEGFVELQADLRCGKGALRQDFEFLRVLPPNYRVVIGSQLDGEARGRGFAQGSLTAVAIPRPRPPGGWDPARFAVAFEAGARQASTPAALAAFAVVLLAAGALRRRFFLFACLAIGALVGSAFDAGALLPLVLLPLATGASLTPGAPASLAALVVGACTTARGGGGALADVLGLALGALTPLAAVSPALLSAGWALERRAAWRERLRWGLTLATAAGSAWLARLSW